MGILCSFDGFRNRDPGMLIPSPESPLTPSVRFRRDYIQGKSRMEANHICVKSRAGAPYSSTEPWEILSLEIVRWTYGAHFAPFYLLFPKF